MFRMKLGGLAAAMVFAASSAHAGDLFSVTGTVSNGTVAANGVPVNQTQSFAESFSNAEDVIKFATSSNFKQVASIYQTDYSAIMSTIAFRGVAINVGFGLNSKTVNFSIPALGISSSFTGADRNGSLNQLKDYLLKDGDILSQLQRALIASSPNDPTAGNPNSLQSQMVANDFTAAGFDTSGTTAQGGATQSDNKIFFGVTAGSFRAQGVSGQTVSLPLSYTARFDADPRYQLQFSLPLTYINQSGAKTGAASIGLGFQFPLTSIDAKNQWYLTPRASVGVTGSVDAAAASILSNLSLTSRYVMDLDAKKLGFLTIANMVGYNFSIPFHIKDVRGDYKIHEIAFKNGVSWQEPLDFNLFGKGRASVQLSYAWTKFTGTQLYMNNYHDVSFSIGRFSDGSNTTALRLGVTGSFGRDFRKVTANFGYIF